MRLENPVIGRRMKRSHPPPMTPLFLGLFVPRLLFLTVFAGPVEEGRGRKERILIPMNSSIPSFSTRYQRRR